MFYNDVFLNYNFEEIKDKIYSADKNDVESALRNEHLDEDGLCALLSPSAEPYIENLARRAAVLTKERFGNTIQIFAPLYLSNECGNGCLYCGFSSNNKDIVRRTLNSAEIEEELKTINAMGVKHILLVCGEAPAKSSIEYLKSAIAIGKKYADFQGIEIYPLSVEGYQELVNAGASGLTIFQETYNQERYTEVHPRGRKKDMPWRLDAPDRGAIAGMRQVGIGALLGLSDPRADSFFTLMHAAYLRKTYWQANISISFPRIREASGRVVIPQDTSDRLLVQIMTTARLFLPDAGITISTREKPSFRDNVLGLGVTQMSAASATEPGGYAKKHVSTSQFEIEDSRGVDDFCRMLRSRGYEPVMKDWDIGL